MRSDDPATQIFSSGTDSVSLQVARRSGEKRCAFGTEYWKITYHRSLHGRESHREPHQPTARTNPVRRYRLYGRAGQIDKKLNPEISAQSNQGTTNRFVGVLG